MKIVYFLYIDLKKHSGVAKKVIDTKQSWEKNNCEVLLICLSPSVPVKHVLQNLPNVLVFKDNRLFGLPTHFIDWILLTVNKRQILKALHAFNPHIFYFRYYPYTPFLRRILDRYPAVYEINTSEKKEYKLQSKISVKYKFYYLYFLLTYKRFYRKIAAVVSVTYEILKDTEIPKHTKTFVSPNAISMQRINWLPPAPHNIRLPVLVFIGSANMPWHGVDILLELARLTIGKLRIEIIGMTIHDAPENVHCHGYLSHDEYRRVLENSDVGIGSLALFRNGMEEACPLKSREYLASGLPIIIAYRDTVFIDEKPWWVFQLPNSKEGILASVNEIVAFAVRCQGKRVPRGEVHRFIEADLIESRKIAFMRTVV